LRCYTYGLAVLNEPGRLLLFSKLRLRWGLCCPILARRRLCCRKPNLNAFETTLVGQFFTVHCANVAFATHATWRPFLYRALDYDDPERRKRRAENATYRRGLPTATSTSLSYAADVTLPCYIGWTKSSRKLPSPERYELDDD
jgi:hypothetical protein